MTKALLLNDENAEMRHSLPCFLGVLLKTLVNPLGEQGLNPSLLYF